MAFTLPQFNLTVNVWFAPHVPSFNLPDAQMPAQLYVNSRFNVVYQTNYLVEPEACAFLRIPKGIFLISRNDIFQCDPLQPQYLVVLQCWPMHMGFPNEYNELLVRQCDGVGAQTRWSVF